MDRQHAEMPAPPDEGSVVSSVRTPGSDPREPLAQLFRDLRTSPDGLSSREAARRLIVYGPNQLSRRRRRRWLPQLLAQFTQPLALLLGVAAVLAWIGGSLALAIAVVAVILLNAAFAFAQEMQAEHAVEALAAFLPETVTVIRDGLRREISAGDLGPGDIQVVAEGDRVCADARIIDGTVQLDMSALTGESEPVSRSAEWAGEGASLLHARDVVFSGTNCTGGEASTVVTRTGMHTELGRIAALSQRGKPESSPLERQVRRATWIIAIIAVAIGVAFLPIGLLANMSWAAAISFSIGLLVANVPEGLLPTITLALAAGVRELAHRGAVVKRLAAVETLGSTNVICTDKTGTLTQNRMTVTGLWLPGQGALDADPTNEAVGDLVNAAAACTTAQPGGATSAERSGDPTELALIRFAAGRGQDELTASRDARRRGRFPFDPHLKRMATIDEGVNGAVVVHVKGAVEAVLPCCTAFAGPSGAGQELTEEARAAALRAVDDYAHHGLRVLAVAARVLDPDRPVPEHREEAESGLTFLGLVALVDPPRAGVAESVARAHQAGMRVNVITGDYGLTAAEIARQVGIGSSGMRVVAGEDLDRMSEADLDELIADESEIVFARSSPEAKLRICQALRAHGAVVAMTGDGVNDAPALRYADIGVAMGRSGTDVAREASTMVLTDDNFATIVTAIEAGRRVFDNVKKFVLYIFAHAVPEVVPFLVFALSGGAVPLPLTVMQILAIDLGTETIPALALGREPAEPGLMNRPPRRPSEGVIDRRMLSRAWGVLGVASAILVMGGFLFTLCSGGWHPGAAVGTGAPLHQLYRQATSMTFLGIVACQIGVAFAARTDHAALRTVGVWSNPLLLWGIGFEVAFSAALVYVPFLQPVFGTAALAPSQLAILIPFSFIVWGIDELRRRRATRSVQSQPDPG